ncbi:hypothetical protein GCM10007147_34130 [Nocardiopsis kunsanensis]|uniref:Uncharacterized protein n=1 Tax=Nocardiopsis kunsanensis TaxID=141693 RepID=A0A919CJI5_9ACTN|nr:hypothetical protein [Nocardiopsis kunsanensis]GHD31343.1 hypothetical protein GCM10007147_34130 [Nocardiopsis kunsanensis]
MRNAATVVSFLVFVVAFVATRDFTRTFLASWVELEGLALWIASFVSSVLLAALAAGLVLQIFRFFDRG